MRKTLATAMAMLAALSGFALSAKAQETVAHHIFDGVTFYDGYRVTDFSAGIDSTEGVLHHATYLYATKLSDEVLNNIGDTLRLNVWVKACCDNYDRIGNVNLALVPKGDTTYSIDNVSRIELGRFITPFMDKNKQPDTCPYTFSVDYLSLILRDADLRSRYDFWMEYELFGVPYAANTQITGCEGRNDVFQGTLDIVTSEPALPQTDTDVLVPIHIKGPNWRYDRGINNYNEACTDTLGKTTKTYTFTVPKDCADAQLVLVTSNHGAGNNGEEYNRRWHYVYVDGELELTYKPGRTSCEPFRQYNTQANGIYGTRKRSNFTWQSFSNWCPGDVIDNRIIYLGAFKAGQHSVRISVPDAVFSGSDGYIPVSVFFQGVTTGNISAIEEVKAEDVATVSLNGERISLDVRDADALANVTLYNAQGQRLYTSATADDISLSSLPKGIYLVNVEMADGLVETHKMLYK